MAPCASSVIAAIALLLLACGQEPGAGNGDGNSPIADRAASDIGVPADASGSDGAGAADTAGGADGADDAGAIDGAALADTGAPEIDAGPSDGGPSDSGPRSCNGTPDGQVETRLCYDAPSPSPGQVCTSTTQSRTCQDGTWTPWPACAYFSCGPGAYVWARRFGVTDEDYGYGIAVDANDTVFVASGYEGQGNNRDFTTLSYTSTGTRRWLTRYGGTARDEALAIATDRAGNFFVTGYAYSTAADLGGGALPGRVSQAPDFVIASYQNDGTHRWSHRITGDGIDRGLAVGTDDAGNVYIAGTFTLSADFGEGTVTSSGSSDIFLISYDNGGGYRWSRTFGGIRQDEARAIAVDGAGNLVITGYFERAIDLGGGRLSNTGSQSIYLAGYDQSGAYRFAEQFTEAPAQRGEGLALSPTGDVWLIGSFTETLDVGGGPLVSAGDWDIVLARFSPLGVHRGSQRFGNSSANLGHAVAVDRTGNVYITGEFMGRLDLGGGLVDWRSRFDIFVAAYAPDGSHRWSKSYGNGLQDERGFAIAVGSQVVITGEIQSTMSFDGHGVSGWVNDGFVLALVP